MHIIKDENGNPVPHGHGDGHCHGHGDGHDHAHEDRHCHSGEDGHCHAREEGPGCAQPQGSHHVHGPMDTKEQMEALLRYMLSHNESHAAELDKMAEKLSGSGFVTASEQVRKAVDEYTKGNLYLSLALSSVKEL